MAYNELIKDFNRIRSYIRDFYVFGFRSREEYARIYGMSPRSYDNERRRVENWIGEYVSSYQNASGKRVFLYASGSNIDHNPLYQVFKAKSFTKNDILLHFYLMDLFSEHEEMDLNTVLDLLGDEYACAFEKAGFPDEKTVRLKLKELVQLGLLRTERKGKRVLYGFHQGDVDLDLPGLWDAVDFFSEEAPLGLVGSFLLDKRRQGPEQKKLFRHKHHYLMHAIDSEILGSLLLAISEKSMIEMQVDNPSMGRFHFKVLPLKIYISAESGREYLLTGDAGKNRFYFTRLDRITWVRRKEKASGWEEAADAFSALEKHLWGISFGRLEDTPKVRHFEMEIRVGKYEPFIIGRLEREKRCGTVTKIEEGHYRFEADVYDPVEALPWICTFIGRILRLESDDPRLVRRFREYLAEMERNYGLAEAKEEAWAKAVPASAGTKAQGEKTRDAAGKQENVVFHEVYGAYYNAVARILAQAVRGELTPRSLMHTVRDQAFAESGINLPDRLLSGEWPFLTEDLETDLKREPSMPLTVLQKRWLRTLADDPRMRLFIDTKEQDILRTQLEDVQPLFETDTCCLFDRFADGDPYTDPDYIMNFRTALRAVKEGRALRLVYQNQHGDVQEMHAFPKAIEYSRREDKFRIHANHLYKGKQREPLRLNMGRVRSCTMLSYRGTPAEEKFHQDSVVLELEDRENALERAMFHFSFLEKKTEQMEEGKYQITLYYPKGDEKEILIRILSFGAPVHAVSEGFIRNEIIARVSSQTGLWSD